MKAFTFVLAVLLLGGASAVTHDALAQEKGGFEEGTVRIVLLDGTTHVGEILSENDGQVRFRTRSGIEMTIPRDQIDRIESLSGKKFERVDPNGSRLFFAPSARPLKRGHGYFAAYELVLPFLSYGITDNIILSAGTPLIPDVIFRAFYFAPKLTVVDRPGMSVAAGGLVAAGEGESAGLGFGVATFGDPTAAVTVGFAYGYADGDVSEKPIFLIAAEYQVSNAMKLITENYVIPGVDEGTIISGGVRFFGDNLAADIGIFASPSSIGDFFVPWLGFAYNFR